MESYQLTAKQYVSPTPAGAYYAVANNSDDPARRFIFALMTQDNSPFLDEEMLLKLSPLDNIQDALELLHHVQKLGWVQAHEENQCAPKGSIEDILPGLLATLSAPGKALLSDQQGFYLSCHGFSHEAAEEVSAVSADLASLQLRHQGLLQNNLGMASAAWAIVNASGDSQLGFWPLFIDNHRFVLALDGLPCMNQPVFTKLVWALCKRYYPAL